MSRLVFAAITSLDGYMADEDGRIDWAMPDAEEHQFVNDLQRDVGLHLYGRRMYEVLVAWETMELEGEPDVIADYARLWRAADKVVYSSTLPDVSSRRTRLERTFDPEVIRRLKAEAGPDMLIGGPTLAARAFEAGLIDEVHVFVAPVIVGGGLRALPVDVRLDLELTAERRFGNGVVYLAYRPSSATMNGANAKPVTTQPARNAVANRLGKPWAGRIDVMSGERGAEANVTGGDRRRAIGNPMTRPRPGFRSASGTAVDSTVAPLSGCGGSI